LRKSFANFRYPARLKQRHEHGNEWDIDWIYPTGFPHRDNPNAIGFVLRPPPFELGLPGHRHTLVILFNGSAVAADFCLPKGKWKLLVDGFHLAVNARGIPGNLDIQGDCHVRPGTGVVLEHA
jgi:hypothetical protein